MNDIIEQCARAGNDAYATHGQSGHLRTARLPDKAAQAFTRAVLAKFKELTAEPTPAMIAHTLPYLDPENEHATKRDKEIAADAATILNTPTYALAQGVLLGADLCRDYRILVEQMWKDIGI